MTDRFTPGPWTYAADDDYGDFFRISGHEQYSIATLHDPLAESCGRLEELEANARLIAAAPELVKALEAITYGIDKYDGAFDWINSNETIKAFEQARAVLEKVKK